MKIYSLYVKNRNLYYLGRQGAYFFLGLVFFTCPELVYSDEHACFCRDQVYRNSNFTVMLQSPPNRLPSNCISADSKAIFVTQNTEALSADSTSNGYLFMWANRCQNGLGRVCIATKGNPVGYKIATQLRTYFSTVSKANTCTLLQLRRYIGADMTELDEKASAEGLVLMNHADAQGMTGIHLDDQCILPDFRVPKKINKIVLDYEVQDGRTSQETALFIKQFVKIAKGSGISVLLYTNPLSSPGIYKSGLTPESIEKIIDELDGIGILITNQKKISVRDNFLMQIRNINNKVDKAYLVVDISAFSVIEMKEIRELALKFNIKKIMLWRNGVIFNEACTTKGYVEAKCLLTGNCH